MIEEWRDIEEFNGKYQVSNFGNIRSVDRIDTTGRKRKGLVLKPCIESQGYYRVTLWFNRKNKKDIRIHALVAKAFIPNTENKRTINHKDGNKLNNHVTNLEWNTYSENHKHAYANGLHKPCMLGKFNEKHHRSKPIKQYDLQLRFLKEYPSLMESHRQTGIGFKQISSAALSGRAAGGYFWKYV